MAPAFTQYVSNYLSDDWYGNCGALHQNLATSCPEGEISEASMHNRKVVVESQLDRPALSVLRHDLSKNDHSPWEAFAQPTPTHGPTGSTGLIAVLKGEDRPKV